MIYYLYPYYTTVIQSCVLFTIISTQNIKQDKAKVTRFNIKTLHVYHPVSALYIYNLKMSMCILT